MMGFYLILGRDRSLAEIGRRLGAVSPCAVYYFPRPQPYPGEPHEVSADRETDLAGVHISLPAYILDEVREVLVQHFHDEAIKIYSLSYADPDWFVELAPCILDDPLVWVLHDNGVVSGQSFLKRMRGSRDWIG